MRSFKYLSTPEAQCQELYAPHVKIFLDRHNVFCYNTCMIDFQNKPFNSDTCNELAQLYGVTSTDIFTAGKAQGLPYIAKRVDISPELEQDMRNCEMHNNATAKRIAAEYNITFDNAVRAIKQLGFTYVTLEMEKSVKELKEARPKKLTAKNPVETIKGTPEKFNPLKRSLSALEAIISQKLLITSNNIEDLSAHFNTTPEVIKRLAGSKYNPTLEDFKIP